MILIFLNRGIVKKVNLTNLNLTRILKFKLLRAKEDYYFDSGALKGKGWFKEDAFLNRGFESFYNNLENEIFENLEITKNIFQV